MVIVKKITIQAQKVEYQRLKSARAKSVEKIIHQHRKEKSSFKEIQRNAKSIQGQYI